MVAAQATTASQSSSTGPQLPAGGFAMPTTSAAATGTLASGAPTATPGGGFTLPGMPASPTGAATQPDAVTASVPPTTAGTNGGVTPASGYAPGSTSGATSYPTTTAGSNGEAGLFYR
jgi:hypothetical protein